MGFLRFFTYGPFTGWSNTGYHGYITGCSTAIYGVYGTLRYHSHAVLPNVSKFQKNHQKWSKKYSGTLADLKVWTHKLWGQSFRGHLTSTIPWDSPAGALSRLSDILNVSKCTSAATIWFPLEVEDTWNPSSSGKQIAVLHPANSTPSPSKPGCTLDHQK